MAEQAMAKLTRWFYRCTDCLSVAAADSKDRNPPAMACSCGGKMMSMGYVHRGRVFQPELRCPCDERCTNAAGPSCDCQCGGENHGSGRLVEIVRDAGAVPVMVSSNPARATEFRASVDAAHARVAAKHANTIGRKEAGAWVDTTAYWAWQDDRQALMHAKGLKTHKGRMSAIAKVAL